MGSQVRALLSPFFLPFPMAGQDGVSIRYFRGHSLAGKALRSQRRDRGFESRCLHFILSLKMLDFLFNASIFKDFLYMYIYYKHIVKYTDYKKVSHGISHAILSKCSLIFLFCRTVSISIVFRYTVFITLSLDHPPR